MFALSGTPQQSIERKPFFFGFLVVELVDMVGYVFPVEPACGPGGVIDILLLVALPFLLRPNMLPLDSLEIPPRLSVPSFAVTPLNPVVVGEGCILCSDDFDGT